MCLPDSMKIQVADFIDFLE
ncbi:hypothetical protein, partial [Pararcticibacter amylolyticus]